MAHEKEVVEADELVELARSKIIEDLKAIIDAKEAEKNERIKLLGERIKSLEKQQDDIHKENIALHEMTFSMITAEVNTILISLGDINNFVEVFKNKYLGTKDATMQKWNEGMKTEAFEDSRAMSMNAVKIIESVQTQIPTMLESMKRLVEKVRVKEAYA